MLCCTDESKTNKITISNPATTTIAAGRYDRNDCVKSGLYLIMIIGGIKL